MNETEKKGLSCGGIDRCWDTDVWGSAVCRALWEFQRVTWGPVGFRCHGFDPQGQTPITFSNLQFSQECDFERPHHQVVV